MAGNMSIGQKILPQVPQTVTNQNIFAPGYLSSVTSAVQKDPKHTLLEEILKPLQAHDLTLGELLHANTRSIDIDLELSLDQGEKATSDMAFVTFMLSRYHKYRTYGTTTNQIYQNYLTRFIVVVGNAQPINFYCMKKYAYAGTEIFLTDNDMVLASILGINAVVASLRKNDIAGMHPLSRTAVTEEGLGAFDEFLMGHDEYSTTFNMRHYGGTKIVPVKLFNTACARKSHQFIGSTRYYIPELAAAQLVTGVMFSKGNSPGLIDLTNWNLRKIAKASGGMNKELFLELMDYCTPASSAYNAEEIYNLYRNKSKLRQLPVVPKTVQSLAGFKVSDKKEGKGSSSKYVLTEDRRR